MFTFMLCFFVCAYLLKMSTFVRPNKTLSLVVTPFLTVSLALAGSKFGDSFSAFGVCIFIAFVCCAFGDTFSCVEDGDYFIPGIVSFGLAHMFFILAYAFSGDFIFC